MIYVDTSVIVALLTVEPKTPDVTAWYAGLRNAPISSDWLLPEFCSAISIKLRTGQLSETNAKRVHKEFDLLAAGGLRLAPVSRSAYSQAAKMVKSHQHGLRAGDSLHLAVALELGASHIATLDGTLARNAKQKGLKLIEF
ncbi:MAG: type II toxin-antitoxin system VapC family toxin [Nitrosomonadaceae bacterium]|nr:type II toxin-antitoxin system VapC family toxin [Nitrosomonadaceae bacterium]